MTSLRVALLNFAFFLSVTSFGHYYNLVHDHVTVDMINKKFVEYAKVKNSMYNRTTRTFTAEFRIYNDTDPTYTVTLQAYQFRSNQYHIYPPCRLSLNICSALSRNMFGLADLLSQFSNMEPKCPIRKGTYVFKDMYYDGEMLPPHLPKGKYKMTIQFHKGKTLLGAGTWFGALEEPKPKTAAAS